MPVACQSCAPERPQTEGIKAREVQRSLRQKSPIFDTSLYTREAIRCGGVAGGQCPPLHPLSHSDSKRRGDHWSPAIRQIFARKTPRF